MDNRIMQGSPLFADQRAMQSMLRGAHDKQNEIDADGLATALLIFCLFFVGVWAVARVFVKPEGATTPSSPRALFRDLCKAHRLSRGDGRLLARLARHHRLSDPAMLFLEPQRFDPAACGDAWKKHAPRLCELRLKLFAGLASRYQGPRT